MKISTEKLKEIIKEELQRVDEGAYPFIDQQGRSLYKKMEELGKHISKNNKDGRILLKNIMKEFLEMQTASIKQKALNK